MSEPSKHSATSCMFCLFILLFSKHPCKSLMLSALSKSLQCSNLHHLSQKTKMGPIGSYVILRSPLLQATKIYQVPRDVSSFVLCLKSNDENPDGSKYSVSSRMWSLRSFLFHILKKRAGCHAAVAPDLFLYSLLDHLNHLK